MIYHEIKIPHIDVNDEKVTIEDLAFKNLDYVEGDQIIFTVSTAKAVEDFICAFSGYIIYLVKDGDEIKMGDTAALIYEEKNEALKKLDLLDNENNPKESINASQKAIDYANKIGFDLHRLKKEGIIKVKDIEEYIENERK
jgi:pyruvate/2-oxoglutarate dehydrogenase complex dihydrolipoamide acyltransferase (E2) component